MNLRKIGAAVAILVASFCNSASAQLSGSVVKIAVIADMTGPYSDIGGMGVVHAVQMAVKDFGGTVLGAPIQVIFSDYSDKVEVAALRAREWYDEDKVDLIIESSDSASAIAMQTIAMERKKPIIFAGAVTAALANKLCSAYGAQWTYNTYALATGTAGAIVRQGGDSWYFITADYAFGHAMERDATAVINRDGGKVLGSAKVPLGTADFSSSLLQAQSSHAKVIGLANAGKDLQNTIRQAAEFGLTQSQALAALLIYDSDIRAMGLQVAQGLQFTTAFYWDTTPETREFSRRFYEVQKAMPNMNQAAAYSATMHYLKGVAAAKTDAAEVVLGEMRDIPVNDFFTKNGRIRIDGQMVHDMYLAEVKKPSESTSQWDIVRIKRTIPGSEAFQPLSASECPLIHGN